MTNTVLVTGGAGYIGAHSIVVLMEAGFDVVVLDNLSSGSRESLERIGRLVRRSPIYVEGDVRDFTLLSSLFGYYDIQSVIHFAGLKSVAESLLDPLSYYDVNVLGTVTLCRAMAAAGVYKLVFSSSATVYGDTVKVPIPETHSADMSLNPYGRSKRMVEKILFDLALADRRWGIAILRYFNPVGAHESGLIGEAPHGNPSNLVPYVAQVALGKYSELQIFGNDYPTHDGTGIRDYIHVMDLAEGHLCAMSAMQNTTGAKVWNLGTGVGYSVIDVVTSFIKTCGREVPYRIVNRRSGDISISVADPTKAQKDLGWKAKRDLNQMMQDTWRWQSLNPHGYD